MSELVAIRAAFERFPAAIKGAFLLRGADGMPHQVRLEAARITELGGGPSRPVPVEPAVLEVGPIQDTFVPFEIATTDLGAGWYRLECDVVIDGEPAIVRPGDRFAMPWPRGVVRRGTVPIGKKVATVALETLECAGDATRLSFAADAEPAVKLFVDGRPHPVLAVEFDPDAGRGRVIGYPVLRSDQRMAIELSGEAPIDLALP